MPFDTSIPFAGAVHDFSRPMRERASSRKVCGPYHWTPASAGAGRGFYMQHDTGELRCADHGAGFRLRVVETGDSFGFSDCGDSYAAIVLRLPRGRGFLAGATMGPGMCAHFEPGIIADEDEARRMARSVAESAAEAQADHDAEERDRLAAEDEAEAEESAAAPGMLAVLESALEAFRDEFENDSPIDGADFLDWFSTWRESAVAAVAAAKARH